MSTQPLYLRVRDRTQAFWSYVHDCQDRPHPALVELLDSDRIYIGRLEARRLLDGLRSGLLDGTRVGPFEDDNMPVEVVDADDRLVQV